MTFFRKSLPVQPSELLSSELHDESTFYERFLEDIEFATTSIYIESPFLSTARSNSLMPYFDAAIASGKRITILTRRPNYASDPLAPELARLINEFRKLSIKVKYSSPRHHRKIVIIDESILYEGSLNVLSHVASEEVMRRLESRALVKQMKDYLRI